MFCFFLFCYNFVSFYLFINKLFFNFLIWNFLCCFKQISSLVSLFFSIIFSFSKLVCRFWQIARLQEFFLLLLLFRHLLLPGWGTWMDGWRDGWMERTTTTIATGQNQGYYIRRLVGARDLRPLWSPPVSLNLVHVLVFFRNF